MAREAILDKLDAFLTRHDPLTEECHVVYLMVAVRKVLDHEDEKGASRLLRFYCDWIVHTAKDRITDDIHVIMEEIYKTAKREIEQASSARAMSPVMQFAYMDELKREMADFLAKREINSTLTESGWLDFVKLLVKVLENQPINKPTANIRMFSFRASSEPSASEASLSLKSQSASLIAITLPTPTERPHKNGNRY